jgi:hypothetical protein
MVGQISSFDLLVADLAVHFHRFAYLGGLLRTAPRHGAVDAVQGGNPVGLPLAQLREIKLILL